MRIVLVISALRGGGAERVMSVLANEMVKQNEVYLVVIADSEINYRISSEVEIINLGFQNNRGRGRKVFAEIKAGYKFRQFLYSNRPDAVLSFMEKNNIFTLLTTRFLRLRVFISDRNNPCLESKYTISALKKWTYPWADGIIAQTSMAKEVLHHKKLNNNITVIPNPIRDIDLPERFQRCQLILTVGRLIPEKGHEYLLEAFSRLNDSNWKLVIIGEGKLRSRLEGKIKELNLSTRVLMPGNVRNLDEWFQKASIFAFPSLSEGFPNALVEAMANGLPCISFDCDAGPRDIIDHGISGFLVKKGDIDGLTAYLQKLIENKTMRESLGIQAIKIKETLKAEKIVAEYVRFITKI